MVSAALDFHRQPFVQRPSTKRPRVREQYDAPAEFELLGRLWELVSLRLNFFTTIRKAVGYSTTVDGRRRRVYDEARHPWQRLQTSDVLDAQ